jgi:hypothetical protein
VLKIIRKHNKWLMVGFGVILMIAWTIQPVFDQISAAYDSRTVATLNGKKVSHREWAIASKEIMALSEMIPELVNALGVEDRDAVHWLILSREAEEAGFVGGERDGEQWEQIVFSLAIQLAYQRYGELTPQVARIPSLMQPFIEEARPRVSTVVMNAAGRQALTLQQTHRALAKARGVTRMIEAYTGAGRMSDRMAVVRAREFLDSAKVDYVFVPAARLIDSIPVPSDEQLREHFDKFKTIRPGTGEFGIGYLLPPRVKLEWLKIDRASLASAVTPNPIEVRQRFNQGKASGKYTGEFAASQPLIEAEMRNQTVDRIVQEAHIAIQTEIQKATRTLEPDGTFKRVPEDWESRRPRFENIASAVVEAVRRQTGVTIPLPTVAVRAADWLTRDEVRALPDIAMSRIAAGGLEIPFDQAVFWTRGLPGSEQSVLPIQPGVPLTEMHLTDAAGNRYYFTVLAIRQESAPDSMEEDREDILRDYRTLRAYEALTPRVAELRSLAVGGGLDSVIAAFPPVPPVPGGEGSTDPKHKALEIVREATVRSEFAGNSDPILNEKEVITTVLDAAARIDPLLPPEKIPADAATVATSVPKRLGVLVAKITALVPVTVEQFRQLEQQIIQQAQVLELRGETPDPSQNPFSFENLLKRHTYTSGKRDIRTPEDLKREQNRPGA